MNRFDLAIIAKPDSLFDPKDQLIIDQFVMNGGRVMWLLDPIAIDTNGAMKGPEGCGPTTGAPVTILALHMAYMKCEC